MIFFRLFRFFTVDIPKPTVDFLTFRHLVEVSPTFLLGDRLAVERALVYLAIDFKDEEFPQLLAVLEGLKFIVPKKFLYPLFANIMMPHKNHKKSRDIFIRESLKMKSVAFRMWLTELFTTQFKLTEYIKSLKENHLPVFLISGKEDYFFFNSVIGTHKKLSEASLCFIEKCGHVCSIEKYELFNSLVLKFIKGQDSAEAALA